MKLKAIPAALVAALCIGLFSSGAVFAEPLSVELESGASRGGEFIAVDETFVTADGQTRELILSGLKPENRDLVIRALEENYTETGEAAALKLIDESFCDAEKYDSYDDEAEYDSAHCWAAAASNMLWISGWTEYFEYPEGMDPFTSEDEIFRIFNKRFTDRGGDTDRGIDWLIMGEYFISGSKPAPSLNDPAAEDGLSKDLVISLAQNQYDLAKNPDDISRLLNIAPAGSGRSDRQSVFQGAIGELSAGELSDSMHAITIAGVIIDPAAQTSDQQFRAIILIDSDNDSTPDEQEKARVEAVTADDESEQKEQRNAEKAAIKADRPNSYTVYPLNRTKDTNGAECWEIVDYSDPESENWQPTILYTMDELEVPSDGLIESIRETEGTRDHVNDPDLTLDVVVLTKDPNGFTDPYYGPMLEEGAVATVFGPNEPIRMNYFASNRSMKNVESDVPENEKPVLTWKVTRDSDGEVVAEGTHRCELPMLAGYTGATQQPNLVTVNEVGGELQSWEPGSYTLTAELNPDHSLREAYFRNNTPQTVKFEVSSDPDAAVKTQTEGAETGDPHKTGLWFTLLAASAAALLFAGKSRRLRLYASVQHGVDDDPRRVG